MILKIDKNGFSGIELAIVIAVLSIFSAVAIPAFNCVRRRAISTAAQETIRQIKEECETNYIYGIDKFNSTNPDKYQISSSGSNSCSGGTVTLTPEDTNLYPTYLYKFEESELSYNFKGQTGTSFVDCNKLICGEASENIADSGNSGGDSNEDKDIVLASNKCTYVEMDNPNDAKWYYHICEEYLQQAALCQHPYVLAQDGPPFPLVTCSSLCELAVNANWSTSWIDYHCVSNKDGLPAWLDANQIPNSSELVEKYVSDFKSFGILK